MSMPYSECRSDLGFASPPVPPPCVFRNRIGCFRLQLSAGRLPLPAADICPPLFLFGRDFCPAVSRFVGNPSALQQRSGSNCLSDDPLFSGPDLPFVRSSAARRKPPPPSFPAALLGHLFFRTFAGVDRQVALQGLLQPHRVDVAAQFAALRDRNAARLLGDYYDDGV